MPLMPFHLPKLGLHSLFSIGTLAAGVYCLAKAFDRSGPAKAPPVADPSDMELAPAERDRPTGSDGAAPWRFGLNPETGLLLAGLGFVGWSLGIGRLAALSRVSGRGRKPRDGVDRRLTRPDGSELHVETYGVPGGVPIVFVHGLGSDCDEWFEIRQRLVRRHRVIDWDLAGLGESTPPRDGDWSLDRAAADLKAVLEATCDRPAVLLGHSLGGMILLGCDLSTALETGVFPSLSAKTRCDPWRS